MDQQLCQAKLSLLCTPDWVVCLFVWLVCYLCYSILLLFNYILFLLLNYLSIFLFLLVLLTAFQVCPSVEGHLKGVLYWGSHTLVNFPPLAPPLRLCICTYLVLSNWRFGLCVQILYLFCLRPPNPTTK